MSRVVVRVAPASLRTNHAGLDLEASALAYRDALDAALRTVLAGHEVEVVIDERAPGLAVEVRSDDVVLTRTIERDVLDHAWVVRQMGHWAVIE